MKENRLVINKGVRRITYNAFNYIYCKYYVYICNEKVTERGGGIRAKLMMFVADCYVQFIIE